MKIDFNENEAQALINLIDAAVRSQGLAAARAADRLADKIREAFNPSTTGGFEPEPEQSEE